MATLLKRLRSPYWVAAFDVTLPDGTVRRLKRSTRCKKRSDATIEAARLEDLENKLVAVNGDGGAKAYAVLSEAAEAAATGQLSEAMAREMLAKITQASTGSPLKFYTVRTWAADWLAMKTTAAKEATAKRYKTSITSFLKWMGDRADARLEAVTKADVRAFRDAVSKGWGGQPRSGATTNFYAADVASMFRAAVRETILLASPSSALEKLPTDDSTEREVFTIAEVSRLVEAAGGLEWQDAIFTPKRPLEEKQAKSDDWQGVILLGFYSGARLGDCARMTWANVDLSAKRLSFVPGKTSRRKKKLEIPIHPRLAAYLEQRPEHAEGGPLFPSLHDKSVAGKAGLSGQFGAISDAAGVDRRTVREAIKDKDGKVLRRSIQARTFHSLRHSLTSTLAGADVSPEIRMRITGHKSASVHSGYTHHEQETLANALGKLPKV